MIENIKTHVTIFLESNTKRDLADSLGLHYSQLMYLLHKKSDQEKYEEFEIKKRRGGTRMIYAPTKKLKIVQTRLNHILQEIYTIKSSVHGFVKDRGIKSNAINHVNKRFIINIDLEDFFPSINFGRVYGLFSAYPFNFPKEVAVAIAQLTCYKNHLPQGSPSSPIISNFICRRLDNSLMTFLSKRRCLYSRYADDITISTNLKELPTDICSVSNNRLELSEFFLQIFENNGFKINHAKTRFAAKNNRQEVTGLIVNEKLNVNQKFIRQVRAMLAAWKKFGIAKAAEEHFTKYNYKNLIKENREVYFRNMLIGKVGYIGHIRGTKDSVYHRLIGRLRQVEPEMRLKYVQEEIKNSDVPIIFGEGRTDCIHLKKALMKLQAQGLFKDLDISLNEYDSGIQINNSQLLEICRSLPKTGISKNLVICVFDRDDADINKNVVENGLPYKHWGSKVYSLLIPRPGHREFDQVCMEHYYLDTEIRAKDKEGRRLFFSTEFEPLTGNHLTEPLYCEPRDRAKSKYPRIIDNNVFNQDKANVALPKTGFASNVYNDVLGFNNFTFFHFKGIFELIAEIDLKSKKDTVST